jgi:hypothetical protein
LTDAHAPAFYPRLPGIVVTLDQVHPYTHPASLISHHGFDPPGLILAVQPLLNTLQHSGCPIGKGPLKYRRLVRRINN